MCAVTSRINSSLIGPINGAREGVKCNMGSKTADLIVYIKMRERSRGIKGENFCALHLLADKRHEQFLEDASVRQPWLLHGHLAQHIGHGVRRLALGLGGDMGVGVQGEACGVVAQHSADGFDVHAVLESQGCKGVAEVVEPHLGQPRPL